MPRGFANAAAAIDAAIADTAASEFGRVTPGLSRDEKANLVAHALNSLHGSIPRLEMPEYAADLVPLFYSIWYQPFQVNSALALISRLIEERRCRQAEKTPLGHRGLWQRRAGDGVRPRARGP